MQPVSAKSELYSSCIATLSSFFHKYQSLTSVARYASIVSVLHSNFPSFHFVGYYLVVMQNEQQVLEMGPYMSTILATPRIGYGKGVCGSAWEERKTQIVDDVRLCKNYIACDNDTLSEIVVPVWEDEDVVAVLDIDGKEKSLFDEVDRKFLEEIVAMK